MLIISHQVLMLILLHLLRQKPEIFVYHISSRKIQKEKMNVLFTFRLEKLHLKLAIINH